MDAATLGVIGDISKGEVFSGVGGTDPRELGEVKRWGNGEAGVIESVYSGLRESWSR